MAERPPSALLEVGDSAESLFDAANSKDWPEAAGQLEALQASAAGVPADLLKPDLAAELRSRVTRLGQSVPARQRVEAMDDANKITRIVIEVIAKFQTRIPNDVILLDYIGRELLLGIASGSLSKLKQTTADLRTAWSRIEPTILERGHTDDARRFTDIVVKLEGARSLDEFVPLARAQLAAVHQLQNIFRSN